MINKTVFFLGLVCIQSFYLIPYSDVLERYLHKNINEIVYSNKGDIMECLKKNRKPDLVTALQSIDWGAGFEGRNIEIDELLYNITFNIRNCNNIEGYCRKPYFTNDISYLIYAHLLDSKERKIAFRSINRLVEGGNRKKIKFLTPLIKEKFQGDESLNRLYLLALCSLSNDEKETLLEKTPENIPVVRAILGDTSVENSILAKGDNLKTMSDK